MHFCHGCSTGSVGHSVMCCLVLITPSVCHVFPPLLLPPSLPPSLPSLPIATPPSPSCISAPADIDECKGTVCSDTQECRNTAGSYFCRCKPGYRSNGSDCEGEPRTWALVCSDTRAHTQCYVTVASLAC